MSVERPETIAPDRAVAGLLVSALGVIPGTGLLLLDEARRCLVLRGPAWAGYGLESAYVEGRPAAEALPRLLWESLAPAVALALRGDVATARIPSRDPRRHLRATVTRVSEPGGGAGVCVVVTDSTELDQARDEVRDREHDVVRTLERSAIGMAIVAADAVLSEVNPTLCRMVDLTEPELRGRSLMALTHPDDATLAILRIQDLLAGRTPMVAQRLRLLGRTGDEVWVDLSMSPLTHAENGAPTYLAQIVDVSTEVANFEVLQRTAAQFRLLAENASDVVVQVDLSGTIRWVSPSLAHVLGWEPASLVGTHLASLVVPEDAPRLPTRAEVMHLRDSDVRSAIVRFRTLRGTVRDMALSLRAVSADDGLADGAVIGLRDVTEEQSARRTLARSEERFRLAMAAAPHGMAIADSTGCFVQVNPALCDLLGVGRPEILGRTMADFLGPDDHPLIEQVEDALVRQRQDSVSLEHHLLAPHREVWVVHAVSILRDERGVPLFYVHQFVDQTEARRLRADLEFRASRDALTGASNRAELMAHLALQLDSARADSRIGVLFVDIDNLKPMNDTFGHQGGDDVITAVARRLSDAVRTEDLVARIGGDEFVVVLDNLAAPDQLRRVADKCLRAVCRPVASMDGEIPVTVSIGAVLASSADTPDAVLRRADSALYVAKESGRNQVALG
ncbi:MAG: PAS domain S-box protein [Candidatus Nanopelagicales bacterium]